MSQDRRPSGLLRTVAGITVTGMLSAGLTAMLVPGPAQAASHREAPLIAGDPQVDNTDVYAFVSPDRPDTVTLIGNWIPFEEPNGGPNFYPFEPGAHYDINIDSDGDAQPNITYRWKFSSNYKTQDTFLYNTGVVTSLDDPDLNFTQTYDLEKITYGTGGPTSEMVLKDVRVAPSDVGPASMPDYTSLRNQAITTLPDGGKSFAGQADDSFFLDLRVFDLLYGGDFSEVGQDTLSGYNVNTIALQVPKSEIALNGNAQANPVIGVWSDTERQSVRVIAPTDQEAAGKVETESGDYAQVSRLGMPLVNEVVIPLKDKDNFNNSTPQNDGQFLEYVRNPEVPRLIEAIYGIDAPATPRNDLVEVFLTGICQECGPVGAGLEADLNSQRMNEDVDPSNFAPSEQLRLNMAIPPTYKPNALGVLGGDLAGFPNGRRLQDDVVDIELRALEGALPPYNRDVSDLGDGVRSNDVSFQSSFPYVALPHDNSVNQDGAAFETARLAGQDRFGTAADIATQTFRQADTVLLASGEEDHFIDALSANYLAGNVYAPVLLTAENKIPQATTDALEKLGADKVIIVGGPAAVSNAQRRSLTGSGYTVDRLGGDDRYETAKLVNAEPGIGYVADGTAIVASGQNWPDALVGGSIAFSARYPVAITPTDQLSPDTRESLAELDIEKVLILGGPAAVSRQVKRQLNGLGIETRRIAGQNRSETAVRVANYALNNLGFTAQHANVARGDVGVDALAGGPNAGVESAPILLTERPGMLGSDAAGFLAAHRRELTQAHVFGGPAAVSGKVVGQIKAAVR